MVKCACKELEESHANPHPGAGARFASAFRFVIALGSGLRLDPSKFPELTLGKHIGVTIPI
jgi:hypothetical protein